jgi:putative tricarboxylic transport membrane protein
MVENSLRQSLLMSGGDPTIFVSRPISGTLFTIMFVVIVGQSIFYLMRKMKKR